MLNRTDKRKRMRNNSSSFSFQSGGRVHIFVVQVDKGTEFLDVIRRFLKNKNAVLVVNDRSFIAVGEMLVYVIIDMRILNAQLGESEPLISCCGNEGIILIRRHFRQSFLQAHPSMSGNTYFGSAVIKRHSHSPLFFRRVIHFSLVRQRVDLVLEKTDLIFKSGDLGGCLGNHCAVGIALGGV